MGQNQVPGLSLQINGLVHPGGDNTCGGLLWRLAAPWQGWLEVSNLRSEISNLRFRSHLAPTPKFRKEPIQRMNSEGGEFRPRDSPPSRVRCCHLFGRPKSAHTHDDVVSRQRIPGCSLQFCYRLVEICLRSEFISARGC